MALEFSISDHLSDETCWKDGMELLYVCDTKLTVRMTGRKKNVFMSMGAFWLWCYIESLFSVCQPHFFLVTLIVQSPAAKWSLWQIPGFGAFLQGYRGLLWAWHTGPPLFIFKCMEVEILRISSVITMRKSWLCLESWGLGVRTAWEFLQ